MKTCNDAPVGYTDHPPVGQWQGWNGGVWHGHSIDAIISLIEYDPITGVLTWKKRWPELFSDGNTSAESNCRAWNGRYAGKQALRARTGRVGHLSGSFLGLRLKAHHAAWIIYFGKGPENQIDHIDRNPENNAISNLREATNSQNSFNKTAQRNNKLGIKGVSFRKDRGKYQASICAGGVRKNLGLFNTPDQASDAYQKASKSAHGEYSILHSIQVTEEIQ